MKFLIGGKNKTMDMDFKKNDFVLYSFNHNDEFAIIKEILTYADNQHVIIELINSKRQIKCPIQEIKRINTEKKHLEKIGFIEIKPNLFELNNILISNIGLHINLDNYISGFCLGDLNQYKNEIIENYKKTGQFDSVSIFKKYPSLHNINQLLDFAENNGILNFPKEDFIFC